MLDLRELPAIGARTFLFGLAISAYSSNSWVWDFWLVAGEGGLGAPGSGAKFLPLLKDAWLTLCEDPPMIY